MRHFSKPLRFSLQIVFACLIWIVGSQPVLAESGWTNFSLGEVTFSAPSDWNVTTQTNDEAYLEGPGGETRLLAFWWEPNEPLLGYDDIVMHEKRVVAGKDALFIYSRFPEVQSLKLAFDTPREDGRQFVFLLESDTEDFSNGSPLFDELTSGIRFGGAAGNDAEAPTPAIAGTRPIPLEMLKLRINEDCEGIDLSNWDHPARDEMNKRPQAHLRWAALCDAKRYPIFGMDFDYDPNGETEDFFRPFFYDLLQANGRWPYAIIVPGDELMIAVSGKSKKEFNVEYQEAPEFSDGVAAPQSSEAASPEQPAAEIPQQPENPAPPLAVAVAAENDPTRPLRPGESQTVSLYAGGEPVAPWSGYEARGGNFKEHVRFDNGALVAHVPKDSAGGFTGIYSEGALLWLDAFRNGGQARLTFTFDPADTTGFLIGLSPDYNLQGNDVSNPRFMLHWRRTADGGAKLTYVRDDANVADVATAADAPENVTLVLREDGLRVEALGFPADLVAWPEVADGQGFRIYAMTRPDQDNEAVSMALHSITLERKAGVAMEAQAGSASVAPLPRRVIFEGKPSDFWQASSNYNNQNAEFVTFIDGAAVADPPKDKNDWVLAGLLSQEPVMPLNERINQISYSVELTFDPRGTTGTQVLFSTTRTTDMWGRDLACAFSFFRVTEGPDAGKTVLELRENSGPYAVWSRKVSSDFLDRNWDGRVRLTFTGTTVTAELPGIVALRAIGLDMLPGLKEYMTVYSLPEKPYAASRMSLMRIEAGWVTPPGMSAQQRWSLVDDADFNADAFADELAQELLAPATQEQNP